jgi:protein-L-isoaspartate O-methyltransferase
MTLTGLSVGWSELGRSLLARNAMTPDWMDAFLAVPRSAFLPDVMWPYDMDTGTSVEIERRKEPARWQDYADANVPIVTQWDDGASAGMGSLCTSSASMPSVVFRMLAALDLEDGHRVLEIGTGTGWNAGILAHRVGQDNVVSIEIDPAVADDARDRLGALGLHGTVLTRDGALGDPAGAPYDRIIATAGLRRIPGEWLRQAPEGLIVAPWGTHFTNGDAVARLTVAEACASGRFAGAVQFMKLRSQRLPFDGHTAYVPHGVAGSYESTTDVTEAELLGESHFDPRRFALGLRVRDCYQLVAGKRDGARPVWFYGLTDRSWACVMFRDGHAEANVYQSGPRKLWEEVSTALHWWQAADEPGHERFGLTVSADGEHRAWLDSQADSWPV